MPISSKEFNIVLKSMANIVQMLLVCREKTSYINLEVLSFLYISNCPIIIKTAKMIALCIPILETVKLFNSVLF